MRDVQTRLRYYAKKPRDVLINAEVTDKVRKISSKRPTYGTRRMAAQVARETDIPTNRKKIQRIYRKIGWNEPQNGKKEIIRASRRRKFKPDAPNQLWETDMTYIHCGVDGWCYCFNVIDALPGNGYHTSLTLQPRHTQQFNQC